MPEAGRFALAVVDRLATVTGERANLAAQPDRRQASRYWPSSSVSNASNWRLCDNLRCRSRGIDRNNTQHKNPRIRTIARGDGKCISL